MPSLPAFDKIIETLVSEGEAACPKSTTGYLAGTPAADHPYATVSRLYGPGAIACWCLVVLWTAMGWARVLKPKPKPKSDNNNNSKDNDPDLSQPKEEPAETAIPPQSRRPLLLTVEFVASLAYPALAAGHLLAQLARLPGRGDPVRTVYFCGSQWVHSAGVLPENVTDIPAAPEVADVYIAQSMLASHCAAMLVAVVAPLALWAVGRFEPWEPSGGRMYRPLMICIIWAAMAWTMLAVWYEALRMSVAGPHTIAAMWSTAWRTLWYFIPDSFVLSFLITIGAASPILALMFLGFAALVFDLLVRAAFGQLYVKGSHLLRGKCRHCEAGPPPGNGKSEAENRAIIRAFFIRTAKRLGIHLFMAGFLGAVAYLAWTIVRGTSMMLGGLLPATGASFFDLDQAGSFAIALAALVYKADGVLFAGTSSRYETVCLWVTALSSMLKRRNEASAQPTPTKLATEGSGE